MISRHVKLWIPCITALLWQVLPVTATQVAAAETEGARIIAWSGGTMGTSYNVKVFVSDPSKFDQEALQFKVDAELRRVNDQMSTYLKSSEISKFNDSQSTDWVDVSKPVAQVVDFAQKLSEKTVGAFDVTVGPLVDAWNFGPAPRTNEIPSDEKLTELSRQVGFKKLSVRLDPPALKKSIANLRVDLSAIAKGHGVDRVVSLLVSSGAENVFVEIGGEVRTAGNKDGQWWKVGIQVPDAKANEFDIAYALSTGSGFDDSIATSGDYRNFIEVDGKRYSHTIDPRTLHPIENQLASVSVVTQSCMEADAWATALSVLGATEGAELATQEGLNTLLVSRSEDGFDRIGTGTLAKYSSGESVADGNESAAAPQVQRQSLAVFGITFVAFALLLFAMAVGVIFSGKAISGSCGGIAGTKTEDGSVSCSLCSNPADACKELREKMKASAGA